MFWVPLGADPADYSAGTTYVFASQGDAVQMGIYYQGADGVDLASNGVQAIVDAFGTQIGAGVTSGTVLADCTLTDASGSIWIDQTRGDYVGFNTTTLAGSECSPGGTRDVLGWVLLNIPVAAETVPGAPDGVYFGQVIYDVSADACGRFVVNYVGTPNLETIIINDSGGAVLDAVFSPLVIVVEPPNDACADATVLADATPAAYATACGVQDGPTPSCSAGGTDVFFEYTATCDADYLDIQVSGGADWAVYDDGCTLASEVACNTGYDPGAAPLPNGTNVVIQLLGDDTSGDITVTCVPLCTAGLPAGSATTVAECGASPDPCLLPYCSDDPGLGLGCLLVSTDPNDAGNTTDGVVCDDGLYCTVGDACDAGECVGPDPRDCSDGALCTEDSCDEDADTCVNTDINSIPCTTVADCPAAASECSAEGFCVCVENPALCLNVETQEGKNCLVGVGVGDEVIVTVDMAFSTAPICAAQFFLSYDNSALDFNSITPGGGIFNTVLLEEVDEAAGTIDYIVGENPGAICAGTNGPATLATISFTAIAECKNEGVCFRGHNPPTILGAADGSSICPLGHLRAPGDPLIAEWGYDCGIYDNPIADPCCTGPFSVDVTPPEINCPDFKTFGNADCGEVTRTVFWDPLFAVDNCDGAIPVNCTISHNGGADVQHLLDKNGGAFPPGVTTIDCDGTSDACNNVSECAFSVGNSGLNGLHVEVELSPTMDAGPLLRGIDFAVSDCGSIANPEPVEVCADVNFGFPFNVPGHGVAQAKIPPGNWLCIEADDPLHTLNATCDVTCETLPQKGSTWFASFKGSKDLSDTCHWLVNGNLNGDIHIDVLDYVTYLACVASDPNPGADTACGTEGPHCDINGDGLVSLLDFSFILVNLFNDAKAGCDAVCNPAATPQVSDATEAISVRQLIADGVDARVARTADVNNDGTVDVSDMALYLQNGGETRDVVRDQSIKGTRSVRGLR
jgi:hypothetical protein